MIDPGGTGRSTMASPRARSRLVGGWNPVEAGLRATTRRVTADRSVKPGTARVGSHLFTGAEDIPEENNRRGAGERFEPRDSPHQ